MSYEVRIARDAERDIAAVHAAVVPRLFKAIKALANDPRPSGCKKLKGAHHERSCPMKKAEPKRTNVQVLRSIRDRLNRTFEGMSSAELLAYFAERRPAKAKSARRPAALRSRTTRAKTKA